MDRNRVYSCNELYNVIHGNKMYDYEEVNLTFIATKIIQLLAKWDKKFFLILRSDFINEETYWFIRYVRSRDIEPSGILSTLLNKEKYPEGVLGIPIYAINDLNIDNTRNCILLVINRESDKGKFTQMDYRESDYGFCMRARAELQFERKRGIENYYHIIQNENKYYQVFHQLEDEESRKTFIEVIRSLIENDVYRYNEYPSSVKYFDSTIYKPLEENEIWINCGSCTGDTILHYLSLDRKYKKIYAIEIDKKMTDHLMNIFELLPKELKENITLLNCYLEGKKSKYNIDRIFEKEKISLINMDVEGFEMEILKGAENKIRVENPVLAIAAYHRPSDLLDIPEFIKNQNTDYHIYFRKYRGYCPEALNEYIYYAVPTERMIGDIKNE